MTAPETITPRLIAALDRNAAEIDVTFATAGRKLGEGLDLFEGLKGRLLTLSSELDGPELVDANKVLSELAFELGLLDEALRSETAALGTLAKHSHTAFEALGRLLENMRLIGILARSARIEAVVVQSVDPDFGDFAGEISAVTRQAYEAIQFSVRDHDRLNKLLAVAMDSQREFQRMYGSALTTLAERLLRSLEEVAKRQTTSIALTRDAANHSGKIALAAGGAIVALQSGDSIRQRLEHAIAGLRFTESIPGTAGSCYMLTDDEKSAAGAVLARLEGNQLRECANELNRDSQAIETSLVLLADDTAALINLVTGAYRTRGGSSGTFLEKLERELVSASEILGKCDNARGQVDAAAFALRFVLDKCRQTVVSLSDTVSDIVLIGLNAGLRAARLGGGGRSLVVIAQELKTVADQIASDASSLMPTFASMETAAATLLRQDRLDARRFGELDGMMKQSLDAMNHSGKRLGATLDQLARESTIFSEVVAQARLAFSNAGAMSDLIAAAADQLANVAPGETTSGSEGKTEIAHLLHDHIWPNYTMAAEREIHIATLAAAGLPCFGMIKSTEASLSDDVDELLF